MLRVRNAMLLALLVAAACTPLPRTTTFERGPLGPLRVVPGRGGHLLAAMDGASGVDVAELPSGDMVLSGYGRRGFVLRLSPEGEVRWRLRGCGNPSIAAGGDDAIYVSFLSEPGTVDSVMGPGPDPECRLTNRSSSTILRVSAMGRIDWRLRVVRSRLHVASEDRVIAVGEGRESSVFSLTPRGNVEWARMERGFVVATAWSPRGAIVVAETRVDGTVALLALDARTGNPLWDLPLAQSWEPSAVVASDKRPCDPRELSISPAGGALLSWCRDAMVLIGFDPDAGTLRWRRKVDLDELSSMEDNPRPTGHRTPIFVGDRFRPGNIYDPVFLGIDPATGQAKPLATLPATDQLATVRVTSARWYRGMLLATGAFYERVSSGDLHLDARSRVVTACSRPGMIVQVELLDGRLYVSRPGPCTSATVKMRRLEEALFLVRIPLGN